MGEENVKTMCQELRNSDPNDNNNLLFVVGTPLCFRAIVRNNWEFPY